MKHSILRSAGVTALCATLMCLSVSCRKDLCYDHFRKASVSLDWELVWERDYGHHHEAGWDDSYHGFSYGSLSPAMPEGVTMLTYGQDPMPTETFMGVEGADVNIGEGGTHSMLLYNNDTEYIVLSDVASLPVARATTTSRSRSSLKNLQSMHPDERSVNPPDVLFAAFVDGVPEIGVHEKEAISAKMQPLVYTYVIRYEFEHGAEHVALARGALAGMAEAVYLRDGVTSEECATLLYDCSMTSYGAVATVRSFGVPGFPDEYYGRTPRSRSDRVYSLNLEVRLTNGTIKEFLFDVSDQIASQPRGGVITVGEIRVEDSENQVTGDFDVTVDDWGDAEDVDLSVGVEFQDK